MTEHVVDTPRVDEPAYTPDPRRWRILGVSLVIGFMALLDVSIVNVAIPSMREGLHTSAGTIQWVVSGYALAFGLTLVAGGRLGDAYGRRRLMLDRAGLLHRLERGGRPRTERRARGAGPARCRARARGC